MPQYHIVHISNLSSALRDCNLDLFSYYIEVRMHPIRFHKPGQSQNALFSPIRSNYCFTSHQSYLLGKTAASPDPRTRTKDPVDLHSSAHNSANPSAW